MIAKILLLAALIPLSAPAQLQVFLFDGTNETPVGSVVNVGTVTPGDTVITRFRVRNIGSTSEVLSTLSLSGSGFSISAAPSLPYTIAPYTGSAASEAEFKVAFSPADVLTYDAFLAVNTINVILQGAGAPSAVLTLAGSTIPLASGSIIDFGSVTANNSKSQTFVLSNPGNVNVTVKSISVTGSAAFKGPAGISTPLTLAPGKSAPFQITFQPNSGQGFQAALAVDQRSFSLIGQGLNPPLPSASIIFGSTVGQSAQQDSVSIPLASASAVSGTGTLSMSFQPGVDGVKDDPAIQFLSGPLRQASVTIQAGSKSALFDGGAPDLEFQTGTTAGTITFTLVLNGASTPAAQATLTIAPAPVSLASVTGVRRLGAVDVSVTAFDNSYTASQLAFTFYDKNGAPMQPGTIKVDASSDFRSYFATTQVGGAFALLASFPVSGDTSQIVSVDFEITNSQGASKTQKITIGN